MNLKVLDTTIAGSGNLEPREPSPEILLYLE